VTNVLALLDQDMGVDSMGGKRVFHRLLGEWGKGGIRGEKAYSSRTTHDEPAELKCDSA
jgi:hypothetical protein